MRRLEYIGGGSEKFWEGARNGVDVVVSWGRIGTAGQTKRREFPTAEAAEEFLAKQVGDKLRKGYVDAGQAPATTASAVTTPTGPVPAEPAPAGGAPTEGASAGPALARPALARPTSAGPVPAGGAPTGPVPAEPVPAKSASAEPAPAGGAAAEPVSAGPALAKSAAAEPVPAEPASTKPSTTAHEPGPDEDTFTPPPGLVRMAFPRRDQGRSRYRPNPDAPAVANQLLVRHRDRLDVVLAHQKSDPRIVEAARRHLGGSPNPLGAAAVAVVLSTAITYYDQDDLSRIAPAWLVDHGLLFAVEAATLTATLAMSQPGLTRATSVLRFIDGAEPPPWHWPGSTVLGDIRAAVAAAGDDEYAAVVARLAELRTDDNTRLVTAFLAPTETAWVDELPTDQQRYDRRNRWMFLAAVHRAEQLAGVDRIGYELDRQGRVLPTIVRTLGPAAAPALARWTDGADTDAARRLVSAIATMPTDEAFTALLARVDRPHVRAAVQEAMRRFPVRATRLLARATAAGEPTPTELLRNHLLARPALLTDVVPTLPPAERAAAEVTQQGVVRLPDAPREALPAVLAAPPWTRERRQTPPVVLAELDLAAPPRVVWEPGERERALAGRDRYSYRRGRDDVDWAAELARVHVENWQYPSLLLHAPTELAAPRLAAWRPGRVYGVEDWGLALLARFDVAAVPTLTHVVAGSSGQDDLRTLSPVLSTETAAVMANALARRKTARPVARAWAARHGLATLPYLLPAALGKAGKVRQAAEVLLRAVAAQVGADAVVAEAARVAGAAAGAGVEQVLATDPLEVLPKKLPVPGAWADTAALPQVRLRGAELALPSAAAADLLTMFALGAPDEPYGGVAQVVEACDPASLAEFGWVVFELWRKAGMPPKDGWALTALGVVGDDETVRRLAPVIRNWPGEGGHARAVTGLDVLAEIGTDVALMHLNGIAQKVKFSGLKHRAGEKIELVAAKLGLTADQLADRLVPDLGLDADGTLLLDYGPRRFVVGFDEGLRPYVSDEDGARRKALPKPGAKDDQDLAVAAYQRFAALKKDVRTLASDQITRLERAMVTGRRWSQEDFAAYFSGHPLLWHVVRRLVWGVYDGDGAPVGAFRLAEDRTLAGADDDLYPLPQDATVGVAHPLHLGAALATWAELFADYEILQPFPQLGRPVLALTDEERAGDRLTRFEKVSVNVGRVLGLTKRGWERATPQDAGVEPGIAKPLPGGWFAVLELKEGIVVGDPTALGDDQEIERVFVSTDRDGWWGRENTPLGVLDAVSASELLVDLTELTAPAVAK